MRGVRGGLQIYGVSGVCPYVLSGWRPAYRQAEVKMVKGSAVVAVGYLY